MKIVPALAVITTELLAIALLVSISDVRYFQCCKVFYLSKLLLWSSIELVWSLCSSFSLSAFHP